jgi:flagellar hook protein FlgE
MPVSGGSSSTNLEQSNTDTALEMVQLLLDQRALQANVRSLITADELQALALQIRL